MKGQGFTVGIVLSMLTAYLLREGTLPGDESIWLRSGVFLVFLLQGWIIPTERFRDQTVAFRHHGFVLAWNFLAIPLLLLPLFFVWPEAISRDLLLGFLFLALLPTTITSAVIFTGEAGGDTAAAITATALSNFLGVFVVALGASWLLATGAGASVAVIYLLVQIGTIVILPLILGQFFRPFFNPANRPGVLSSVRRTSQGVVLFILFITFKDAFAAETFLVAGAGPFILAAGLSLLLLLLISAVVWMTRAVASSLASQQISAFFCASQKSLAVGAPFASLLLANRPDGPDPGLFLLPLLCYHILQLVFAGLLLPALRKWNSSDN